MFQIYKNDIKMILSNYAALIVVIALAILPSLYAWFNIKASWDPYAAEGTSKIKIGVVNLDQGVVLQDQEIRIGDMIVEELKENHQLGWQFTDEQTAREKVEKGQYYAMITITKDFSKSLTSVVTSNVTKGKIIYTVNEKINAIAPKLTDKGVTSLQAMITKTVAETVSSTVLEIAKQVGLDIEEQIPKISNAYEKLLGLEDKFELINTTVDETQQGIITFNELLAEIQKQMTVIRQLLTDTRQLGIGLRQFIASSQNLIDQIIPVISQDIVMADSFADEITAHTAMIKDELDIEKETIVNRIEELKIKISTQQELLQSFSHLLSGIEALSSGQTFSELISQFNEFSEALTNQLTGLSKWQSDLENDSLDTNTVTFPLNSILDQIIATSSQIKNVLNQMSGNFEDSFLESAQKILQTSYNTADQTVTMIETAIDKLPELEQILNTAVIAGQKGIEAVTYIQNLLPEAETKVHEFTQILGEINSNEGLENLIRLLKTDVSLRSDFLSEPVEIIEEKLYPISNYGTGMTPFYTILSLWVGILLLVSVFSVDAAGNYRPYQVYFGKLFFFSTITILQALIVALGNLYILRISCSNPLIFVAGSVLSSITFTVIVYSLVSVFGNLGKVIAIILLVLQVAGSGGTFPIQLIPVFFQRINPFLPFTYGISFLREAIGGIVWSVLLQNLYVLLGLIALFILMAVVLKKPINRMLHKFVIKFHESRLGA